MFRGVSFMASGQLSNGSRAGGGGLPLLGCALLNSCEGVCPKKLIWSSTACGGADQLWKELWSNKAVYKYSTPLLLINVVSALSTC